jgi:hypothetical protein
MSITDAVQKAKVQDIIDSPQFQELVSKAIKKVISDNMTLGEVLVADTHKVFVNFPCYIVRTINFNQYYNNLR